MRIVVTTFAVTFFCFIVVAQSDNQTAPMSETLPIQVIIALDRSGSMRDNDPQSMRCQAAHDFIEELRKKSPESYVGVVVFSSRIDEKMSLGPLSLKDTIQFDSLWNSIEMASNQPSNFRPNPPVLSKTLATFQGAAFVAALDWLVQLKSTVSRIMKQHIIMITDDGWYELSDVSAIYIMSTYRSRFPQGAFPKIHTVVLTGSGNPAQQGLRGIENIKAIADSTGGLYIEDATPPTIVTKLISILDTISDKVDIENRGLKPVMRSRSVTANNYSLFSLLGVKVLPQKRTTAGNATGVYIIQKNIEHRKFVKIAGNEKGDCSPE